MNIQLELVQTVVVALVVLFVGYTLNKKINFLKNNNIPEPVVGGIVFALASSLLYSQFGISFSFDMTLKTPLMLESFLPPWDWEPALNYWLVAALKFSCFWE